MRLIDADELRILYEDDEYSEFRTAMRVIRQNIDDMPTIDAVPVVHGKWVHNETYELANGDLVGEAYCSKCELYSTQISNEGKVSYAFCPRCGAKMDGGDPDAAD